MGRTPFSVSEIQNRINQILSKYDNDLETMREARYDSDLSIAERRQADSDVKTYNRYRQLLRLRSVQEASRVGNERNNHNAPASSNNQSTVTLANSGVANNDVSGENPFLMVSGNSSRVICFCQNCKRIQNDVDVSYALEFSFISSANIKPLRNYTFVKKTYANETHRSYYVCKQCKEHLTNPSIDVSHDSKHSFAAFVWSFFK